jgi:hypothetical protein
MIPAWVVMSAFVLPFPWLAIQAARRMRALPALPPQGLASLEASGPEAPTDPEDHGPGAFGSGISILIPARNEAHNLAALLPSLGALHFPAPYEIIVIDDGSSDGTAQIAAEFDARLVTISELPAGWLGKPHACHLGAQAASFDWLLFTDADTRHHPDGPARAVQYSVDHGLDGLSLFLNENNAGLAEKLAMTAAFAGLFAGMAPGRPLLNGQYILLRREAYHRSGGFEAVRSEKLEDLALAHRLAACGLQVPTIWGSGAAEVRMYGGFQHLWHGLTRLGAGSLKWAGPGGWLTALFITGALTPVLLVPVALFGLAPAGWVLLTWVLVCVFFLPLARRAGSPALALGMPFGALLVQLAASWGLVSIWLGRGVRWKERLVR